MCLIVSRIAVAPFCSAKKGGNVNFQNHIAVIVSALLTGSYLQIGVFLRIHAEPSPKESHGGENAEGGQVEEHVGVC